MAKNKKARIPHKFLPWIAIRKQYALTHAEVQMARELGLEPRRFPSYANIKDQPWKKPLKEFIAELYLKQTGKEQPETVFSMEDLAAQHVARRLAKKQAKLERLAAGEAEELGDETSEPEAETPDMEGDVPEALPPSDPEPVPTTPDPAPEPTETPPAKSASPWEAARARLNAKSSANPDDPDLTSGPMAT